MRQILMKDDLVAIISDKCEILYGPYGPRECQYAGYVIVENSNELPIFTFFWPKPINSMTQADIQLIYNKICEIWPCFTDYIFYEAYVYQDEDGEWIIEDNEGRAPMIFVKEFMNMTVENDSICTFRCTSLGEPPIIRYEWQEHSISEHL